MKEQTGCIKNGGTAAGWQDNAVISRLQAQGMQTETLQKAGRKAKGRSPRVISAGLPGHGIGYLLEEIMAEHFTDAVQQVNAHAAPAEDVVHVRTLAGYLGGKPTGIATLLAEHFTYTVS